MGIPIRLQTNIARRLALCLTLKADLTSLFQLVVALGCGPRRHRPPRLLLARYLELDGRVGGDLRQHFLYF